MCSIVETLYLEACLPVEVSALSGFFCAQEIADEEKNESPLSNFTFTS